MNGGSIPHPSVVYETANQELRTVRFFFKETNDIVLQIKWEPDIKAGATVQPNQKLAEIRWEMQASQDIMAPPGCHGVVEKTNRRIKLEKLAKDSEHLLSLRLPLMTS
jgi:hypothetical protein